MKTKRMSLKQKLALGFFVPIILFVAIIAITFFMVLRTEKHSKTAQKTIIESIEHIDIANQMQKDTIQVQQWLTDVSATRGKDGLGDGFEKAAKHASSFQKGIDKFKEMYERENNQGDLAKIKGLETSFKEFYVATQKMAHAYVKSGTQEGNAMMENVDTSAEVLTTKLDPFVKQQEEEAMSNAQNVVSSLGSFRLLLAILGLTTIALTVVIAFAIGASIMRPIRLIVSNISGSSKQVSSGATETSSMSQALAEGASEQASSLEEISSSLEEMASMTRQNAENADQACLIALDAKKAAEKGNAATGEMTQAMDLISTTARQTAGIIKVIDEIAFQTNLLALNAAVEAARAGDAGRGFAVVAKEVRNLAQKSAEAAKDTSLLIQESLSNSDGGAKIIINLAKSLAEIMSENNKLSNLISEISAANKEQAQGIGQVSIAVNQMDKVTQQNASSAEQSAAASEEMSMQAGLLDKSVRALSILIDGHK